MIGSGAGELFALDATTGKQVWARSTGGLPVRGAGDDGNLTAVTLGNAESPGSVLLVIARDGSVKRQVETDKVLGVPAMLGGYVFVPWSNQYVSAFDSVSGEEVARITLREKVSRAWTQSAALYFGELGIFVSTITSKTLRKTELRTSRFPSANCLARRVCSFPEPKKFRRAQTHSTKRVSMRGPPAEKMVRTASTFSASTRRTIAS